MNMSEKQYEVMVTPFAETAIQSQEDYLRFTLYSDQAADHWLDMMEHVLMDLAFLPERYPIIDREPWHSERVRYHVVEGYIVYFWIAEKKKTVYLVDVISQRLDQDKRLLASTQAFEQHNSR